MDHYRAFLAGQRDKSPGKDEGMAQYIGEWERRWAQMSGGSNDNGSLPFLTLQWTAQDPLTDNTQKSRGFRSSGDHA